MIVIVQMAFSNVYSRGTCLYFRCNLAYGFSCGTTWQNVTIGLGNGIDVVKRHNIAWTNNHNSDVIMGAMASQITSLTIVSQPFIQAQIKENIKAPRH